MKGKEKWEICVDDEMGNGNKEAKTLTQPGGPTCSHDLRGILGPFHFHKPFSKPKLQFPFLTSCVFISHTTKGGIWKVSQCVNFSVSTSLG